MTRATQSPSLSTNRMPPTCNSSPLKLAFVPLRNFGDALNPWVWKQLLGDLLDTSDVNCSPSHLEAPVTLYSIGSYLDEGFLKRASKTHRIVVAGTGAGYGIARVRFSAGVHFPYRHRTRFSLPLPRHADVGTEGVRFYWVRGPLTAHLMGLPPTCAIADGAYLIRRVIQREALPQRGHGIAYMPHISTCDKTTHREICEDLNISFIDPRDDRETIIAEIARARILITEALHGAIVSDALRTPWVPVRTSLSILDIKWLDYCSSIGIEYKPHFLRSIWQPSQLRATQRLTPKKVLFDIRSRWSNAFVTRDMIARDFMIAAAMPPCLSSDNVVSRIDAQLEEKVEQLRMDIESNGIFLY